MNKVCHCKMQNFFCASEYRDQMKFIETILLVNLIVLKKNVFLILRLSVRLYTICLCNSLVGSTFRERKTLSLKK